MNSEKNISFIINLTTVYNMSNYELWFIPYIQTKKILEFKRMAHQLQIGDDNNEHYFKLANAKFKICRNLWHNYLKRDDLNTPARLKLILVCDAMMFPNQISQQQIIEKYVNQLKDIFSEDERKRIYVHIVFLYNLSDDKYNTLLKNNSKKDYHINFTTDRVLNKEICFNYLYNPISKLDYQLDFKKLSLFLANNIDWFGLGNYSNKESELRLLTTDNNKTTFNVKNVVLNDKKIDEYIEKYALLDNDLDKYQQKVLTKDYQVKLFKVKELDFETLLKIDENLKNKFLTFDNNIGSNTPFFFSNSKFEERKKAFDKDYFTPIENEIKKNLAEINKNFYFGDNLEEEVEQKSIKDIRGELDNLLKEEEKSKLESYVDVEKLEKAKEEHSKNNKLLIDRYLNNYKNLIEIGKVVVFYVLFGVLFFSFLQPLYRFEFFETSLLPFSIISGLVLLIGVLAIFFYRNKIKKSYTDIYLNNAKLMSGLEEYVEELQRLSKNLYNGQIRKEKIKHLQKIVKEHESEIHQISYYKEFLGTINFNHKNKPDLQEAILEYNFKKSPYDNNILIQLSKEKVIVKVDKTNKEYESEFNHFGFISKIDLTKN